ncbi:MAG TPA: protein translocase subunit SecD [Polyangiaceae bacterium]|jgi:preprotein translocase subunit SecD|nr:protein translocase subunit SecD [Polyangiaceae bacterium]
MVDLVLQYGWAAFATLLALIGYAKRSARGLLWLSAIFAGSAALSAHYQAFWPMVWMGVLSLWTGYGVLNLVDSGWRVRSGLVLSVGLLSFLGLWPTLENMSGGLFPCPAYVKEHVSARLVSGLDLRGGLRLVYTVDVDEAIKDRRDRRYEDMMVALTKLFELHKGEDRPSEEEYQKLRERIDLQAVKGMAGALSLQVKSPADIPKIDARFLDEFSTDLTYSKSADGAHYDFRIKQSVDTQIRESAVGQAKEIILRRVDELGLREASVSTRDEDVIVEVPGEDESSFREIREIISQTARLEFKLLDDDTDFFDSISRNPPADLPKGVEFEHENTSVGVDSSGGVARKQITFAVIHKDDKETNKEALARLRAWCETLELPQDRELGFETIYNTDPDTLKQSEAGWRTYLLKRRAEITGDLIRDAQAQPDTSQGALGGWYVGIQFTDAGGRIFEKITGANIKRRFAIILDERVESAPVIQDRIGGGNARITLGSSDPERQVEDARKLELVLKSGALPAPITPSNEQRIGPSLGRDSIRLAVKGAAFGGLAVLLFMMVYYHIAGLIADIAVVMNIFLQLAILASFGASMTLPGIAGLALTMGMSVDSNVLINERIREEIDLGKTPRAAVDLGYSRALAAIIDGHVTTLISAIVLAQFGTGPIKGFAVTLIVGVAVSIFTGVMVSRVMFDFWVRRVPKSGKLNLG